MTPHISIIGAGSRGTSLAQVVADKGHQVLLWSLDAKDIALINQCHINPSYIKEVQLPDSIVATDSLSDALQRAEYVIFAVPSCAFVPVLTQLQPYYTGQKIIIATKGFFPSKDFLFSSQLQQQLPSASFAFLYGPSHAEEVIQRMPTWVTVASAERSYANELSFLFQTDYFHCEISTDIVGIQIIAGLKNVIALLCGMSDGLGAGVNQKSVIVTKGIQEIGKLSQKFGGSSDTVYGISGLGDVVVTAMSPLSRNRQAGKYLAEGHTKGMITQVLMHMVVESFSTLEALPYLLGTEKQEYPLLSGAMEISEGKRAVQELCTFF